MIDIEKMRGSCERLQWKLDQVDWEAPGAETLGAERVASLAPFMGDLYWIESVAAVAFGAMARSTDDATLKPIFESFAADEQRHADAELRLMERWGMVDRGCLPDANVNLKLLLRTLGEHAHRVHPSVFAAIIPMTELVLDGALVRYLTDAVDDPVCHQVFEKINADEARHLAVDFYVLEKYGRERSAWRNAADLAKSAARAPALYAFFFGYVPVLARSRRNIVAAGLDLNKVRACLQRYVDLGANNPDIARHPTYVLIRAYTKLLVDGRHSVGDLLLRASDAFARH
jgi:hypothetical protein